MFLSDSHFLNRNVQYRLKKKKGDSILADTFNPILLKNILTLNRKIVTLGGSVVKAISYPVKGDLIIMSLDGVEAFKYRVLKNNGNIVEVVSQMPLQNASIFGDTNTYANSTLDVYLNTTYYNTLTETAKSAIVPKNIIQYQYASDSSKYNTTTHSSYADYATKSQKGVIGNRYVYALDVEDIEEYFNGTFGKTDMWKMLWDLDVEPGSYAFWLRSCINTDNIDAYNIAATNGMIDTMSCEFHARVHPAFCIDLNKIPFTKTTEVIS